MKILAIDTSCDETSAAMTEGTRVLSNVIWSQASAHASFGGVMPSLAQRIHNERIDWVVKKALVCKPDAVAVTVGPGLAIALEVGVRKAKELALEFKVPLIPVNHIEGHVLSSLAQPNITPSSPLNLRGETKFPALGLVVSGGHTELILIKEIGKYEILAKTQDDALGEALDKAARMLGLGYPGGAVLEKVARLASSTRAYTLPLPMAGREDQNSFSYSGLKTALLRLIATEGQALLTKQNICNLAAVFQNRAFEHLIRVTRNSIKSLPSPLFEKEGGTLLVGGGVIANTELRKRLRVLGKELGLQVRFPYSKKLIGDNAAMIGVAASFGKAKDLEKVDRKPRWGIDLI